MMKLAKQFLRVAVCLCVILLVPSAYLVPALALSITALFGKDLLVFAGLPTNGLTAKDWE